MSNLEKNTILQLSTGHLSELTVEVLDAEKLDMSVFTRDEGFVVYAGHYDPENDKPWPEEFPKDLKNCMRFAAVNGIEWLMFDVDGEQVDQLPYYEDGKTPSQGSIGEKHDLQVEKVIFKETETDVIFQEVVDFDPLTDMFLRVAETPVLADGDFDAPEGCWIGIGDAAVRLHPAPDGLSVSVYRNGHENGECLSSVFVDNEDLQAKPDEDGPEM